MKPEIAISPCTAGSQQEWDEALESAAPMEGSTKGPIKNDYASTKAMELCQKETVNISLSAIAMLAACIWICGHSMGARIHSVRLEINCIRFVLDLQAHMRMGDIGVRDTYANPTMRGSREHNPRRLPKGASAREKNVELPMPGAWPNQLL